MAHNNPNEFQAELFPNRYLFFVVIGTAVLFYSIGVVSEDPVLKKEFFVSYSEQNILTPSSCFP